MATEITIPTGTESVDYDDPIQEYAEALAHLEDLTITDALIAMPVHSDIAGISLVLLLTTGGQFRQLHILDMTREGCSRPWLINSACRPSEEDAVTFAQTLQRMKPETPALTKDRYQHGLNAALALLNQNRGGIIFRLTEASNAKIKNMINIWSIENLKK